MKITLCVSVPNEGEQLLALLAMSASLLASGDHTIELHYTCHGQDQQDRVLRTEIALPITASHIVSRELPKYFQANSVTHSRCVNALFDGCDSDIAIICDYDTAFTYKGWDKVVVDSIINRGNAFFGAPYSKLNPLNVKLGNAAVSALKYQGKPNCIFVAYAPARIKALTSSLCSFAALYGTPDALPLRLISNPTERAQFGLPIGSFVQIDTGSDIAVLIESHKLASETLTRKVEDYLVVAAPRESAQWPENLKPEEYFHDKKPFLAHFRKGASKSQAVTGQMGYDREHFIRDINAQIDRIA